MPVFQVLSPLFYSQLATHPDPAALAASILAQAPSSRTVHVEPSAAAIQAIHSDLYCNSACIKRESLLEFLRWWLLGALCRASGPRPLDHFVRATAPAESRQEYARAVAAIRLTALVAAGMPELLDTAWWVARVILSWWSLKAVIGALRALEEGWTVGGNYGRNDWSFAWGLLDFWLTIEAALAGKY